MSNLKYRMLAKFDALSAYRSRVEFDCVAWPTLMDEMCAEQSPTCEGCPVFAATGETACGGSPWYRMSYAIIGLHREQVLSEPLPEVLAMREFLDGLDWSGQP